MLLRWELIETSFKCCLFWSFLKLDINVDYLFMSRFPRKKHLAVNHTYFFVSATNTVHRCLSTDANRAEQGFVYLSRKTIVIVYRWITGIHNGYLGSQSFYIKKWLWPVIPLIDEFVECHCLSFSGNFGIIFLYNRCIYVRFIVCHSLATEQSPTFSLSFNAIITIITITKWWWWL